MSKKSYLDDAAQTPSERDKFAELRVKPSVDEPDFELEPGRWALCSPGSILPKKDYAKVKKAAKNAKRGEYMVYDEKLGCLLFPKITAGEFQAETILEGQNLKLIEIVDGIIAIMDNSLIGSERNPNVLRFSLQKPVQGFLKRGSKLTSIQLWRDTGDGRACVDIVC